MANRDARCKRIAALRNLYSLGAHLFPFQVHRSPDDPTSKSYALPAGWQAQRAGWSDIEASPEHVGLVVGSLGLSCVDVDVKDGATDPERQRLGIERWALVVAWAGTDTPAVEQTPTRGLHGYFRRRGAHPKRMVELKGIPGRLEVFGDTGFVELFDPARLLKHLDALPVLPHDLSGADELATRYAGNGRGHVEGDRNQGLYDKLLAALANDDDPALAVQQAVDAALAAGLPEREVRRTLESARQSRAAAAGRGRWQATDAGASEIARIIESWQAEFGSAPASRQLRVSRSALGRLNAHVQGSDADAVRVMQCMADVLREKGDDGVRQLFADRVQAGIQAGIAWGASLEPEWLVPRWLPNGRLVFMFAAGGLGKSRLSVQLAVALAVGHPEWLPGTWEAPGIDLDGKPRKVAYISWEDTGKSMHRMVHAAARCLGIEEPRTAIEGMLDFFYVGGMGPLWSPGDERHTSVVAGITEAGRWVEALMQGYDVLILDPLAAVYGSDENIRTLVRDFVAYWDNAAQRQECSLLILGHSSKKDLVSGSTDWENGVRCVVGVEWVERKGEGPKGPRGGKGETVVLGHSLRLSAVKMNEAAKPMPRWLTPGPEGHGWCVTTREGSER